MHVNNINDSLCNKKYSLQTTSSATSFHNTHLCIIDCSGFVIRTCQCDGAVREYDQRE